MLEEVYKIFEYDLLINFNIQKKVILINIIEKITNFGGIANIQKDIKVIKNIRQYPFQ
jgi:hypothetical protein